MIILHEGNRTARERQSHVQMRCLPGSTPFSSTGIHAGFFCILLQRHRSAGRYGDGLSRMATCSFQSARMKKISKGRVWEYLVLMARYWLAIILLLYSMAKLMGYQFYTNPDLLAAHVKDANLFQLSWFLADHQPFKSFVAIAQITTALLLMINRTAVIGALMAIPIWVNILIWDLSFMEGIMATQFGFRISYYLLLTGLVLWAYRDQIVLAYTYLTRHTQGLLPRRILLYVSLPVVGYALEFVVGKLVNLSGYVYHFLTNL